jgi:transposase
MDLTDAQWAVLEPLFRPKRRADGRGRPWQDTRAVLNGVFWVLRTGAPWHDLPSRYPSYQTCHRRFQHWQRSGLLTRLLQKLAEDLRDRGKLDLSESFIDASFSGAKKGALPMAYTSSRRTNSCASQRRRRTAGFCAATGVAGKSNAYSPGFITFVAPSFAGNTTQRISSGWFNSLAL